ncbi:hypothetical protein AB3S75_003233 [Citrus x aurantiifolia]
MSFHILLDRKRHPRHFGHNLSRSLSIQTHERCCGHLGRHGFAVAITGAESIGKGLIRNGTVLVTFPVRCQCIVFRPFKGEILGAGVTVVNKMGFLAEAGAVQIFCVKPYRNTKDQKLLLTKQPTIITINFVLN